MPAPSQPPAPEAPARTPWWRAPSLGALAPVVAAVWLLWLGGMATGNRWAVFAEWWPLSLTMAAGSVIAGATSEGGGAVAFPVMTLVLGIAPAVARDFALCIQAVGMSAAALVILRTRTPVVAEALATGSLAGAVGLVIGLEWVAPHIAPAVAKLAFTSTWLAFGLVLLAAQRRPDRRPGTAAGVSRGALALAGLFGGVVVSISGSGLDICVFSLLVLRGRVSESVATPTSVVLMAGNALVGAAYRELAMGGLAPEAWRGWWACVPIVVVGAPLGALAIRHVRRTTVVGLLLVSIAVQYGAAVWILPMRPALWLFSAGCVGAAAAAFGLIGRPASPYQGASGATASSSSSTSGQTTGSSSSSTHQLAE